MTELNNTKDLTYEESCLTPNRRDQLRPSKKFKRLSVEASARIKCCRKCTCIWFI